MRATAFQAKLAKVTAERDHFRSDLEVMRQALDSKFEEMARVLHDRDRRIAELVVEMVSLRQALEEAKRAAGERPNPAVEEPAVEVRR
jgi:hypothetical protein